MLGFFSPNSPCFISVIAVYRSLRLAAGKQWEVPVWGVGISRKRCLIIFGTKGRKAETLLSTRDISIHYEVLKKSL